MQFYCVGKELVLSSKQKIIVKRAGVGYYYRLLSLLLSITEISKDLERMKNNLDDIKALIQKMAELNRLNNAITLNIEPFISVQWRKIKEQYKKLVIETILDLNRYDNDSETQETVTSKQIEENYISMLALFTEWGYTLEQFEALTNYQACAIIEQWKKLRIHKMNDIRVAMNADGDEYKKYSLELQGYNLISPEESIMQGGL